MMYLLVGGHYTSTGKGQSKPVNYRRLSLQTLSLSSIVRIAWGLKSVCFIYKKTVRPSQRTAWLHYNDQSVTVLQGNNSCLLQESCGIRNCFLRLCFIYEK